MVSGFAALVDLFDSQLDELRYEHPPALRPSWLEISRRSRSPLVPVHVLMGGEDPGDGEWKTHPEHARIFIGTLDMVRLVSGGRKSDRVRHQLDKEGGGTAEGYGSVPFHRTEWTAKKIIASFVVDVELLRSYGLPEPVTELLRNLALWEIHRFLVSGLRLRIAELIPQGREIFGDGGPLTVEWSGKKG